MVARVDKLFQPIQPPPHQIEKIINYFQIKKAHKVDATIDPALWWDGGDYQDDYREQQQKLGHEWFSKIKLGKKSLLACESFVDTFGELFNSDYIRENDKILSKEIVSEKNRNKKVQDLLAIWANYISCKLVIYASSEI